MQIAPECTIEITTEMSANTIASHTHTHIHTHDAHEMKNADSIAIFRSPESIYER